MAQKVRVAIALCLVLQLKPALLAGDFTACMKLLQHLPSFDPKALISSAMRLRQVQRHRLVFVAVVEG